ncbi:Gag-Pol polyprotein [Gossypium australe]|uniref:Gag-Pol polyprotein n=1 Tax=Gossypium australe TaxID=47621 RepID=A0A5B6X356_9ROSI|nr:Gag-Pol polyprotein [Gossypium australe]
MLQIAYTGRDTVMLSNRAKSEEAESNAQASLKRALSSSRRPVSEDRGEEAKEAFFEMMNEWFTEFLRTNPIVQQPLPPTSQPIKSVNIGQKNLGLLLKMIRKKAKFWMENTIRVLDELSCTPTEYLKCDVKKYISQRFLDKKRKEFLELKQRNMTVFEYEREFVRLSKNARECIPTEVAMCKRFEEGLNEDIKLLVRIF